MGAVMDELLGHLPANKRRHIEAIVVLIHEATTVEMIVLFGSHARGDAVYDPAGGYFSDYDILVIVADEMTVENHNLWSSLENEFHNLTGPTPVGLIVHDIQDLNHQLQQGWYFFTDVKNEGIVLYDSGRYQLAETQPQSPTQWRVYARQCFAKYFANAEQAFTHAMDSIPRGWNSWAAFLLHQATEAYYYKCSLLVITTYRPKTHNIETLGKRCVSLDPAFRDVFPRDDPDSERQFKLLKAAYVSARYSLSYRISREDLETLAHRIVILRERTEEVCERYIASLRNQQDHR